MTYDVFLSHNTADKPAVRHLKECLSSRGIKCWFDEADLQSGSNWMAQMEDGLRQSRCCAIFYGPSGVGPWHEMERQLAQLMAAEAWRAGQRFGIIPVRLPDAPEWRMLALPQFLRLYTSVDFPSLSDSSALNLLIAGILQEAPPPEEPDLSRPPYIGMRPFTEADSSVYSSRSNYVLHIAERIQRAEIPRFLSVLGASGGGKSSLLNAGVLPHLRQGTIYPSTKDWSYVTLRPGSDAWSNLRAAMAGHPLLMPLVTYVPSSIEKWLHEVASAAVGNQQGGRRFVLIVDQFEELFTSLPQGGSAAEQKRRENYLSNSWRPFAQNLAYAARETSGPVYVLISMRSDFLGYFADDEDLGPLLADAHQRCVIQPLSEQEVRASIERPAVARKVNFETALVEAVVQDYLLDPQGALPFLQEALLRVWQKGGRTRLALSDYREFGGLQGAVNAHADAMLERFQKESPEKVILIPPIFIHLTRLADDGPDTKRRRPLAELPGGEPAQALARELATEDYRLLVLGDWSPQPGERENPDPSGPADVVDKHEKASIRPTAAVEIAHESLLVGWQKLKSWLNDKQKRPDRLRLRRLEGIARAWREDDSDSRPSPLRGNELRRAERLCQKFRDETPTVLEDYLQSSKKSARWRFWRNCFLGSAAAGVLGIGAWSASPQLKEWREEMRAEDLRRQLKVALVEPKFDPYSAGVISAELLKIRPDDSDAWAVRARALMEQGDDPGFEATVETWQKNVSPRPAKIDDLYGDRAAKRGNTTEALKHWAAFVRSALNPEERKAGLTKLANGYAENGQWQAASKAYNELIRLDNSLSNHIRLIYTYQALRDWQGMQAEIDWANRNYPTAPETLALSRIRLDPAMIAASDARVEKAPRDPDAWLQRAMILTEQRLYQPALDDITMARKFAADSLRLKVEEAYLRWQLNKQLPEDLGVVTPTQWKDESGTLTAALEAAAPFLTAFRAADTLVNVEPENPDFLILRGRFLARLGQHTLAVEDFDRARELDAHSASALEERAASYRALGKTQAAENDLRRAAELQSRSVENP